MLATEARQTALRALLDEQRNRIEDLKLSVEELKIQVEDDAQFAALHTHEAKVYRSNDVVVVSWPLHPGDGPAIYGDKQ